MIVRFDSWVCYRGKGLYAKGCYRWRKMRNTALCYLPKNILIKFQKSIDKQGKLCYYNSRVMTDVTKVHGPLAQLVRATGS